MKRRIFAFLAAIPAIVILVAPSFAYAAKPTIGGSSTKPTPTVEMGGYDVSYPQCGKRLPTDHYFGVVGVNGGTAASTNPCLAAQLKWAESAKTGSNQPKVQLYVNTANPAQDSAYTWTSWPTESTANNPYGVCSGVQTNDLACSWQYGWNRSVETDSYFTAQATQAGLTSSDAGDYMWWLDVETMNSWQTGSADALGRNVAAIEGFASYYQLKGAKVGIYSTAYQWGVITGNSFSEYSNLLRLPNWRPSGSSLNTAKANCAVDPLTPGGYISLTQYVSKNLDHNHSCV